MSEGLLGYWVGSTLGAATFPVLWVWMGAAVCLSPKPIAWGVAASLVWSVVYPVIANLSNGAPPFDLAFAVQNLLAAVLVGCILFGLRMGWVGWRMRNRS